MKTETYTVEIEAWYTLDIPVPHGPREYWGLPGLILQVSDGTMTYLCTKVVLNPEKGIRIKKPRRGKKITAEQFDTEIAKASESTIKQQAPSKPGSENTHY